MTRVERIQELLAKKAEIDGELAQIKKDAREEKAALNANRKPRQKKEEA